MTTMTKRAREMSPEEQASTLAEIKRGQKPEPMPPLSESANQKERDDWLLEYRRRHR